MNNIPLSEKLLYFIKESGFTASRAFSIAGIERMKGLEFISGSHLPDRDTLIRLCIALNVSPDDTQKLLWENGYPTLSEDDTKDSYILFALKQGGDISGLNDALINAGCDGI